MRWFTTRGRRVFGRALSIATPAATSRTPGIPQYCSPLAYRFRQSDQQRDRLENRILRPPPAMERRGLPRGLEQRAGRLLRSGRPRQRRLRRRTDQTIEFADVETSFVAVHHPRADGAGWGFLEHQRADQLALPGREQSRAARELRRARPNTDNRSYAVDNPYGPTGGPSANSPPLQFNLRLRYQWTMNSYNAFVQAGATHTAHSFTQSSVNPTLSAGGNVSTTMLRFENPPISQFDASVRRREGCLDGGAICPEPDQCDQEHVHLDEPVHSGGDHHAAPDDRGQDRL